MKGSKLVTAAIAAALAMLTAFGACGCMISAFGLSLEEPSRLAFAWTMAALFCAAAFSWKRGGIAVLLAAGLGIGYLWRQGSFWEQLWQLVYRVSHIYNRAYHWGVFKLVETPWDAGTAELPMLVLGVLLAAVTAWSVCRQQSAMMPVALAVLTLVSCVVVTDTVPGEKDLYLLLLGLVLLLLTSQTRKSDRCQADRLTALAALPAALLLGVLFLTAPQEGYVNYTEALRERLTAWLQSLPQESGVEISQAVMPAPAEEPEKVDLASLGSRRDSMVPVMEVTAETGGTLYLRGQDYDVYDGTGWLASPKRVEEFRYDGVRLGYVAVEARREQKGLYLPYYPRDGLSLIGGAYANTRLAREYSFVRMGLPENWRALAEEGETAPFATAGADARYRNLPEDTRAALAPMVEPLVAGRTATWDKASAIAAFVRESAPYDKNTGRMPETATDFALWFLEEGEKGYCVHFATAATVLLRAAGLEARYVSGYMVELPPEETVTVTGEHAHAWAEYYEPGLQAWVVLEATPADGTPAPQETQSPQTLPETTREEPEEPSPETSSPEAATQAIAATEISTEPEKTAAQTAPAPEAPKLWNGLLWLFLLAAAAEGQRRLRLLLRRRYLRMGKPNRRALKRWREAEKLAKRLREEPPEELEALAQKAKFSQHTLTAQELGIFDRYLREAGHRLREKPWYYQLCYRYIFAYF